MTHLSRVNEDGCFFKHYSSEISPLTSLDLEEAKVSFINTERMLPESVKAYTTTTTTTTYTIVAIGGPVAFVDPNILPDPEDE